MMITWAKIKTLSGMLVEKWIQYLIAYVDQQAKWNDIIDLVAKMHVLFEAIHPFEDGNGRVGRILINYLLVSQWYPNIIIKWTDKAKKKYFEALEEWEKWLYTYFPDAIPWNDWDTTGDFSLLKDILYTSLFSSMDRVILHSSENIETLISVVSICEKYWYSDEYARKLVQRWWVVAVKKDNTRYTKEAYFYKPLKHKHDK
jgi:Fic family protein